MTNIKNWDKFKEVSFLVLLYYSFMVQISKKITGEVVISSDIFKEIQKEIKNISDFEKKIKSSLNKKTTELLEIILSGSIALNASDIHFEPKENELRIRLRIDGILQDILTFNLDIYQSILSRIKLLSAIKLDVANRPQDGRFSIIISDLTTQGFSSNLLQKEEPSIEIRTSSLPTEYGESIVLRVLNPKSLIKLADLGLRKDLLKILRHIETKNPKEIRLLTNAKSFYYEDYSKKISKIKNLKIITRLYGHNPKIHDAITRTRSEERRVGKECRSRWSPYH